MKKHIGLIIIALVIIIAISTLVILPRSKKTTTTITPTPTPRLVELTTEDRPQISLTPRNDGHELILKLTLISSNISKIEYELTYIAVDNDLEIEKGASGIIDSQDIVSGNAERKILLGTESCTNGCKYKYDTGITGGNLNLTFTTSNGQISVFDSPFILKTTADIKKIGKLVWDQEDFTYTPSKLSGNNFYIAHKDYKNGGYMVTSSSSL